MWRIVGMAVLAAAICGLAATAGKPFPEDEVHPLLSTALQVQWRETTAITPQGAVAADPHRQVTVILEPIAGRASRIHDSAVRMAGGQVVARSSSLVRVQIAVGQLQDLADNVSGILWIREPLRPVPLAVESQGVALSGASSFHDAGITGEGVKVAVIDLGFDGLTEAQGVGELQNVVSTVDYTGVGLQSGEVHGTGVAEIVEDMAPDAELYLLKIADAVDLENAVQYCIDQGVTVINHSVGWYNSNYYDGTGVIGAIASNARDHGILWVNSAGNEAADGHWQGDLVDTDGDRFHEFGAGADFVDGDAIDEGGRVYAPAGDTLIIWMSWNDWPASDQDYDLYLYNSAGEIVDSSTGWQSGSQSPTEAIAYDVTASGNYEIVIYEYDAPEAPEFEIYGYLVSGANTGFEYHDPVSTIIAPANSSDVVAVGAIRASNWTTGPQEVFSSRGPSNASVLASSRTKPDISGPDGTLSTTYGLFYGTSASSPHVAGAAALLMSEDPDRTPDEVQALLESTAIDMGVAGKDNVYGAGRLNLEPTTHSDPRAYWQLNEGSGSVAGDSSGNENDGAIVGANWVSGSPDGTNALSFDGVNDMVTVPSDPSLQFSDAMTVEAWIKLDAIDGTQRIVSCDGPTSTDNHFLLYQRDGHVRFAVQLDRWRTAIGSSVLSTGTWIHVAGVFTGTRVEVYVDGQLDGVADYTGTIGTGMNPEPITLGAKIDGTQALDGTVDEVRLSATALGSGEFNLLPGGPPAATPPAQVADFAASDGADSQSTLTWTNPSDADLGYVVVQRTTGGYPTDHTDGTTVYEDASPVPGGSASTTDTGLTNGATYYYAVFSRDATDWNDTVTEGDSADTGSPSELPTPGEYAAYWQLNEGSGSVAGDSSGNGNGGTISGASWVNGSPDGTTALSFDGVNDMVSVSPDPSLEFGSTMTVEAWIKLDAIDGTQRIVSRDGPVSSDNYFLLYQRDGELRFAVQLDRWRTAIGSSVLSTGTWIHVAGVFTGTRVEVYVDGQLDGVADYTGTIGTGMDPEPISLGAKIDGSQALDGTIDEVRLSGTALDPGELNLLPGEPPAATPPVQVANFTASDGADSESVLTWTNPSDADLGRVVVQRTTGGYPADHTDGTTVYEDASPTPGGSASTTDTGLTNGTTYYYAVFGRDATDWNDTVTEGDNADTGSPSEPPAPGEYAAYWQVNEGSGSVAGDSSGNGNDGTISGASWVSGSPDGTTALSFDGIDDMVTVPADPSLQFSSAMTVEAWIKLDAIDGTQRIVSCDGPTSTDNHFLLYQRDGHVRFAVQLDRWRTAIGSAVLRTGTWTHVAGVFTGTRVEVYVDGELDSAADYTGAIGAGMNEEPVILGAKVDGTQALDGTVDEVRLSATALDPGEFQLLPAVQPSAVTDGAVSLETVVAPNPVREFPVRISVDDGRVQSIEVEIYTLAGTKIHTSKPVPGRTYTWDGWTDDGRGALSRGIYIVHVRATTSAGDVTLPPVQIAILADIDPSDARPLSAASVPLSITPTPTRTAPIQFTTQAAVTRARLSIYSASGELVYDSDWVSGDHVEWNLRTMSGSMASSGAYIYVHEAALIGGEIKVSRGTVFVRP